MVKKPVKRATRIIRKRPDIVAKVRKAAYRATCLSPDQLLLCAEGKGGKADARHLKECALCRMELARLQGKPVHRKPQIKLVAVTSSRRRPGRLRGDDAPSYTFDLAGARGSILIRQVPTPDGYALVGHWLGYVKTNLVAYISLIQSDRVIRETRLNDQGRFEFTGLEPGEYGLWLEHADTRAALPPINVGRPGGDLATR